ncbi:MAG: SDR family oxidoreductase [Candidatus Micrarchaeota archaeon]|nr:SDR family oxidoreductase [Candidatus Micrarchaeota archaeon]
MVRKSLVGTTVAITGSSKGIGEEIAYIFAENKANLILTYNEDKTGIERVASNCVKKGKNEISVEFYKLDLTSNESITSFFDNVKKNHKKIDVLINNAGYIQWKRLEEQTFEEIERQIRTNLEGLIKLTKLFIPLVRGGMIINIASGAGKEGYATLSTYCSTKFGVRGFTQSLAKELKDVSVVSVNPGMTSTRMTNFRGIHPRKVAEVVLKVCNGEILPDANNDVDVWEHVIF